MVELVIQFRNAEVRTTKVYLLNTNPERGWNSTCLSFQVSLFQLRLTGLCFFLSLFYPLSLSICLSLFLKTMNSFFFKSLNPHSNKTFLLFFLCKKIPLYTLLYKNIVTCPTSKFIIYAA